MHFVFNSLLIYVFVINQKSDLSKDKTFTNSSLEVEPIDNSR